MSLFDHLYLPCPKCGTYAYSQSKGGDCMMQVYYYPNVSDSVLADVLNEEYGCPQCGCVFAVKAQFSISEINDNDIKKTQWQTMENAPKDRPILAWCKHGGTRYEQGTRTIYGTYAEFLSYPKDGLQLVEWHREPNDGECLSHDPGWWFVIGTDFEVAANPIYWMLPEPPETL